MGKQDFLLRIVKTWNLNPKPEYRGFRCADCQKYMKKAWHYWLNKGGYKSPVHFCSKCNKDFELDRLEVKKPTLKVNKSKFLKFPRNISLKLKEIVDKWNIKTRPAYKVFACDNCAENMHKAYHVWAVQEKILTETHFCKQCGDKIGFK